MSLHAEVNHRFPSTAALTAYVSRQLVSICPDVSARDSELIDRHLSNALARLRPILSRVLIFQRDQFEHLNSLQYATFLYLLANEIWTQERENDTSERLFLLNKSLHAIDLFYKVRLPPVFFICHGVGTVIGNASYGDNLIVFQNVTVGRLGEKIPVIGNNVVLYPNCLVLGSSSIGSNSVVSAGTAVINRTVPDDSIAFSNGGEIVIKARRASYQSMYLSNPS